MGVEDTREAQFQHFVAQQGAIDSQNQSVFGGVILSALGDGQYTHEETVVPLHLLYGLPFHQDMYVLYVHYPEWEVV